MVKEKPPKKPKMVTITLELPDDLYFKILQACIDRRETIDQFIVKACEEYIAFKKKEKK